MVYSLSFFSGYRVFKRPRRIHRMVHQGLIDEETLNDESERALLLFRQAAGCHVLHTASTIFADSSGELETIFFALTSTCQRISLAGADRYLGLPRVDCKRGRFLATAFAALDSCPTTMVRTSRALIYLRILWSFRRDSAVSRPHWASSTLYPYSEFLRGMRRRTVVEASQCCQISVMVLAAAAPAGPQQA